MEAPILSLASGQLLLTVQMHLSCLSCHEAALNYYLHSLAVHALLQRLWRNVLVNHSCHAIQGAINQFAWMQKAFQGYQPPSWQEVQ